MHNRSEEASSLLVGDASSDVSSDPPSLNPPNGGSGDNDTQQGGSNFGW